MALSLRPGLSFCCIEQTFIFLDRNADRYFGLPQPLALCLQSLINDDPIPPSTHEIELLRRAKLVVDGEGEPIEPCIHRSARESILARESDAGFSWIGLAGVLFRLMKMRGQLRRPGLPRLLHEIVASRSTARGLTSPTYSLRELAESYDASRQLYLSADHCLTRALTLHNHAAGLGFGVTLVFGVQLHPFSAHCWVEHAGLVLDDNAEHISRFKPILVL